MKSRWALWSLAMMLVAGWARLAPVCVAAASKAVGDPPVIDEHPIVRTVSDGGHVALSVVAHGSVPLSYRWLRNEQPLTNGGRITGATNAVLNIDPVQIADSGTYSVMITNASGSITSSPAAVTVNPIGITLTPQGSTGALVTILGQIGEVYRIEVSTNFFPYFTNGYATNLDGQAQFFDLNTGGGFRQLRVLFDHMLPVLYSTSVGTMRAYGKLNQAWQFEGTADFKTWAQIGAVTNLTGWVTFGDPRDFIPIIQFYRIVPP